MAKLPLIRRVLREDIPDADEWVLPLLISLNSFMDSVYNALNRSLTFGENIDGQWKSFRIVAGATADLNKFRFISAMGTKPRGLTIEQVTQVENVYTPILSPVFAGWRVDADQIAIESITGLAAGKTYDITVLVK